MVMIDYRLASCPRRVLYVAAHPDDAEFMAGGTLARWAAGGAAIHYLLVTDGTGGSRDPYQTPEQLAAIRRSEQRRAADVLGVGSITFLGYPDGWVEPSLDLRLAIAREIRRVRPDVVMAQDPLFRYSANYINHPDHRAVADATLAAIMPTANTRLASLALLEEGLPPHDVSEVYLATPTMPTVWMPLSADELARKLRALREHESQLVNWDAEYAARQWAIQAAVGARAYGIGCDFAEEFAYIGLRAPEAAQPYNAQETRTDILEPVMARALVERV